MLNLDINPDYVTRAQELRRALLECLEMLRPEMREPEWAKATRAYVILTYRYVDGLSMEEIAGKLALSRRQAYREHEKGLKAIASLLWDRTQRQKKTGRLMPAALGEDRLEAIRAEVERLRQAGGGCESLKVGEVLEGVRTLLTPIMQRTGKQIQIPPPDTWPFIIADRVMLRQALLNLLSHALCNVKGDLSITAAQSQGNLLIGIREIPPAASTTRPVRAPSSSEDKVSLAAVHALIEAQGGCLEVRDQNERWEAQVSLLMPEKMTVLVIDDNADIVALFQRYLGGHQVSVIGATEGEQALRLAAELHPQVIILDVMMPRQDGWEIMQRLKESPDTRDSPIIVCSVLSEPQLALSMGASAYITKPVSQVEFLTVLQRYLEPLRTAAQPQRAQPAVAA